MSKKEYIVEHFTKDEEIIRDYKELIRPLKERFRFMIYYNTLLSLGLLYYFKNLLYIAERFYPNRRKGLHNVVLIGTLHCFGLITLLLGGNCLALGLNPREFHRKYKELDKKMMLKDPYYEVTKINEVLDIYQIYKNNNNK
jgi:hypothetical protein